MKIERFEEIKAWQAARVLANLIYHATDDGAFAKDFGLQDQIKRASGSVMHNIAEGFESGSEAEFIRFRKYARRSASEVQSESYRALDHKYLTDQQFQATYDKATDVKKLINSFIGYLGRKTI